MSEIAKVIEEAKAAVVYKEGRAYLFEKGTDEFKNIVGSWEEMTEKLCRCLRSGSVSMNIRGQK